MKIPVKSALVAGLVLGVMWTGSRLIRPGLVAVGERLTDQLTAAGFTVTTEALFEVTWLGELSVNGLEIFGETAWGTVRVSFDQILLESSGLGSAAVGARIDAITARGANAIITVVDQPEGVQATVEVETVPHRTVVDGVTGTAREVATRAQGDSTVSLPGLRIQDSSFRIVRRDGSEIVGSGLEVRLGTVKGPSGLSRLSDMTATGRVQLGRLHGGEGRSWITAVDGALELGHGPLLSVQFTSSSPSGGRMSGALQVERLEEGGAYTTTINGTALDVGYFLGVPSRAEEPAYSLLQGPTTVDVTEGLDSEARFGFGALYLQGKGALIGSGSLAAEGTLEVTAGTVAPIPMFVALEERVGRSPLPGSSYDDFVVAFTIADGFLSFAPFQVRMGAGALCASGRLHLRSQQLDSVLMSIRFPRDEFRASGRVAAGLSVLTDDNGMTVVPLEVAGTVNDPVVSLGLTSSEIGALIEVDRVARAEVLRAAMSPGCVLD